MFNARCRIVDASQDGRITSDYVSNWVYPSSNLTDFVGDLRVHFAECPPLYQIPASHAPPAPVVPTPPPPPPHAGAAEPVTFNPLSAGVSRPSASQQQPTSQRPALFPGASLWAGLTSPPSQTAMNQPPPIRPTQRQQPQQAVNLSPQSSGGVIQPSGSSSVWGPALAQHADQVEAQRRETVAKRRATAYHVALNTALTARLAGALEAAASADMERQLNIQSELQSRSTTANREIAKLQQEREALDAAAHKLQASANALNKWLRENEPRAQIVRAAVSGEIDPDEAIIPSDPLSQQALTAQAADLALEDTLAALDKALEGKKVPLDEYLSQVRAVSRHQFIARALSSKIASMQEMERKATAAAAALAQARLSASSSAGAGAGTGAGAGGVSLLQGATTISAYPPPVSAPAPATLPIGDIYHTSGGILLNPLAAAARNMRS